MEIPDKTFFKIGEVAKLLDVEPYVLRYWESEFDVLAPEKTKSGQRVYQRPDIELLTTIRDLLYVEMYTIAGARRQLERQQAGRVGASAGHEQTAGASTESRNVEVIRELTAERDALRRDFEALREQLEHASQQVQSAQQRLGHSELEIGELRAELDATNTQLVASREEVERSRAELETSRTELEHVQAAFDGLRDEHDILGAELAASREELEALHLAIHHERAQDEAESAAKWHEVIARLERELVEANERAEQVRNQHQAEAARREMRRRGLMASLRHEVAGLSVLAEARS